MDSTLLQVLLVEDPQRSTARSLTFIFKQEGGAPWYVMESLCGHLTAAQTVKKLRHLADTLERSEVLYGNQKERSQ